MRTRLNKIPFKNFFIWEFFKLYDGKNAVFLKIGGWGPKKLLNF